MRKITQQAVEAFICRDTFRSGNTCVALDSPIGEPETVTMYLHGNAIAKVNVNGVWVSCGGWTSTTTKERLNGLLSELGLGNVYQKDYVWYFADGSEFNTDSWNKVK